MKACVDSARTSVAPDEAVEHRAELHVLDFAMPQSIGAAMSFGSPLHLHLVEDDVGLRDRLTSYLERQGLGVTALGSAEELLHRLDRSRPDLVLLDIGLPGINGLQACQKLRADGDSLPIILLTARGDEVDRVLGLEIGADDYLVKPFSPRELLARIHAVLRRTSTRVGKLSDKTNTINIGRWQFQITSRWLRREGQTKVLSTIEYALLTELATNPGVPMSRERLLAASHARADAVLLRAIDVAIMRLRKIVEPDPTLPQFIQTVRGHGYMFVPH